METEIEAKFPDINKSEIRKKLKALSATLVQKEFLMKRKTLDFPDGRLHKIGGWGRIRDEGSKITLSYKQLNDRTLHGTQEVTVVVDNFDRAFEFVKALGLVQIAHQETKREIWKYKDTEIAIDTWPWIPPFLEIEGPTEKAVKDTASKLGLDWKKAMHGSVETVYQMHYDFTESEIDHWPQITFIDPPEWLLKKKLR